MFRAFFPPIFWTRYSCEYKKTFFRTFLRQFFPIFLLPLLVCFWKYCFARFFLPILGHDIRVIIKNVLSHCFPTIFFLTFFARTIGVILEILFRAFSPPFWSRYSCKFKKYFFALFCDDFFPNIFCSLY